jgi:hypothetical protein
MQTIRLNIDKFLGLHDDSLGDTELKIGELSDMKNFFITKNFDVQKRGGYLSKLTTPTGEIIQGQWYGKIGATYFHLFASNGHIYKLNSDGTTADLGTLTDASTSFFYFGDAVYIQNGTEYKKWTGTGSISDVVGYTPLIMNSRNMGSSSTGTAQEGINNLTSQRRMKFNGVSAQTVAYLVETNINSVDLVYVDGVLKTVTTDYTVDLTAGTVTFVTAPAVGVDNVEIFYSTATSQSTLILNQSKARLYGGKNDTRVFIFGYDNNIYYSGLADGVPSAEYFPALNFIAVGNNNTKVTDLSKQYDRLILFKEDSTGWTNYEYTDVLGVEFPIYPLNDTVGCSVLGSSQLVENNPFTIHNNRLYQFVATNVRDERNAKYMSDRVQPRFDSEDMSNLITFDNEKSGELWLILGDFAYIYNYILDVWYYYEFADAITSICYTDHLTIGTSVGDIMKFNGYLTDDLVAINGYLETGYINYSYYNNFKSLDRVWLSNKPFAKSTCNFYIQTDRNAKLLIDTIIYNNLTFAGFDFSNLSFSTSYNPQSNMIKTKVRKFNYIKFIFENNTDDELAILSLTAPSILGLMSR